MVKASCVDEIMDGMFRSMGLSKTAEDAVAEFKAKLAAASTETAVDALYAQYKGQLRWDTQNDWEALVNIRKDQLRKVQQGQRVEDGPAMDVLAYLVEIADALDSFGFAGIAGIIDDTICKVSAYKTE